MTRCRTREQGRTARCRARERGPYGVVQGRGAGLDEREQAGTKWDVSLKTKTDDTKDDSIHAKTANTKAKHKDEA